jgi:monoterpene epsilon-lactone hydrolase
VRGRWYRPRTSRSGGTILYFHGGGYVGTSPSMYAAFVASLASRTGCEVFVVDYRLAPEFPFPAAINDATAVLTGALDTGTDPSRLLIAGDSAGGGLATALMCATEMNDLATVAGLILFSPEVDLRLDKPSTTENAYLDILPSTIPTTAYLQGVDPGLRCVSAIEHEIGRWPPTFVSFGAHEVFRDSIRLLVRRLDDAGIDTIAIEEPGMFHVFPILVPWAAAAQRTIDAVQGFAATVLASDAVEPQSG